jgi:hypothetical protein
MAAMSASTSPLISVAPGPPLENISVATISAQPASASASPAQNEPRGRL